MVSETEITVRGRLGANPELQKSSTGNAWLRLRVATNRRVRHGEVWTDGPTSWYDVKLWGDFAQNVAESVHKGDPVIVQGALQIEEYPNSNGVTMRTPVIHANAFGPDLRHLTARLARVNRVEEQASAPRADGSPVDLSGMQEVGDLDDELAPGVDDAVPDDDRELSGV